MSADDATAAGLLDAARIAHALELLALRWTDVEEVHQVGDTHWDIALSTDVLLRVDRIELPGSLILSAPIGRPPVDRRHLVYENLLAYNSLWKTTAGVRFALDAPQGEVLLLAEYPLAALDEETLAAVLQRFARFADQWCGYVTAPASSPIPSSPSPMLLMTLLA